MKITVNTEERLVLIDRPWAMAGVVWLMGFAALYGGLTGAGMEGWGERILVLCLGLGACAIAWWFFGFLTMTFDCASGLVIREIQRVGQTTQSEWQLDRVERVRLQSERGEGGGRMVRLALQAKDSVEPLELGYSGFGRDHIETAINAWLASLPDRSGV